MKNKYKLLFVFALVGFLFATTVSAKELTLDTLDKTIADKYADAKDSAAYLYVIGDYAFSSEHTLTLQDVIYASTHSKHNISEELSNITIYYLQRTSDEDDKWNGWTEADAVIGEGKLIGSDKKFNLTYIDYQDLEDRIAVNSDTNVKNYVKSITGSNFFTKEYDDASGTLTITLAESVLKGTNPSGTNLVNGLVDLFKNKGYVSMELSYGDANYVINNDDQALTNITKAFTELFKKIKESNNVTDASINVKFNLGEMYKESGTHYSKYTVKFTSVVDVDEMLKNYISTSAGTLKGKKLAITLDNNTINVIVKGDATSADKISTLSGTGLITALTGLIGDARVNQISINDVIVSKTSDGAQVKKALQDLLKGDTDELTSLAGKTLTFKVELNDGLGVLDNKATNTSDTSRTYTIKFMQEVKSTQTSKSCVENIIKNLFGNDSIELSTLDTKSGKNVYVANIKTADGKVVTTLNDTIKTTLGEYDSVEVVIDGTTYVLKKDDSNSVSENALTEALKDKELSTFAGKDITIKYVLKANTLDGSENVVTDDGYTEYTVKVRYTVDTDGTVKKAIEDTNNNKLAAGDYSDSIIGMSFDEESHVITFELKHPMVSVKNLVSKIKTGFETALKTLLEKNNYSTIVVNFNDTDYEIKVTKAEDSTTLVNGLDTLISSIESSTLYQIKNANIKVTFNLNNGVMDVTHGDTEKVEYTIQLSDKINVQEVIENALAKYDSGSSTNSRLVFNKEAKAFYLLYSNKNKKMSDFGTVISESLFNSSNGTIIKLLKADERITDIVVTMGGKEIKIVQSSHWESNGLKDEFDKAIEALVKEALDEEYTSASDVTLDQLQSVINNKDLLKIKVNLKNNYAVTEEDGTTSYEYSVKLSRYTNTTTIINNIHIAGAKLSSTKFYGNKHEIEFKVDSGDLKFESEAANSIYTALNNDSFKNVEVSGRKTGTDTLNNLVTLTKESTKDDTDGKYDDAEKVKELTSVIKDLIGIGHDATQLSELVGYDIVITVNLSDGYLSENGNSVETYTIHFVA